MPESGKTLSGTAIAETLAKLTGQKLFSIHDFKKYPFTKISTIEDLKNATHGIVLLDEFWLTLDSRNWQANRELTNWVLQARKKNILCFYTSQTMGQIDTRLRSITDWQIYCESSKAGIWLTFILYQYGIIGSKFLLNNPKFWYDHFDTNEALLPLKSLERPGARPAGFP